MAHYLEYGGLETRSPHPLFEPDVYLARSPDVAAAKLNPLAHYLHHGRFESRSINRYFDAVWYLANYPDVANAGADPVKHYLENGAYEGRNPSTLFDTSWYLEANPEVAVAGENPLGHFLKVGEKERRGPVDSHAEYRMWSLRRAEQTVAERREIEEHISVLSWQPRFAIVCLTSTSPKRINQSALERQPYKCWELLAPENIDLAAKAFDYYIFVESEHCMDWRALYEYTSIIIERDSPSLIYCDSDFRSASGECSKPFFKPNWSPDYLESFNYINFGGCFSAALVERHWPESASFYDFILRCTEGRADVYHVPAVLYHHESPFAHAETNEVATHALTKRLNRTGRRGCIKEINNTGFYRRIPDTHKRPLISVIIPTAGKTILVEGRRIDLIVNCIEKIILSSTFRDLEFIVVDNGDLDDDQVLQLSALGVRRVTYNDKVFNVSKKLNLGASLASGQMLLLMNDDIEPLSADWIEIMLAEFEKDWVGVVGAKLLYPDNTIQHAGVILKDGNPDHVRKFYPKDELGYFGSTCANRNYVAVTGACMMTKRSLFMDIGGYNESLAVSYNDVDYCFAVRERGFSAVYAAHAELTHFESQSRTPTLELSEAKYFHERWRHMLNYDEYYNTDVFSTNPPDFKVQFSIRSI